jgi:hypothetical protein
VGSTGNYRLISCGSLSVSSVCSLSLSLSPLSSSHSPARAIDSTMHINRRCAGPPVVVRLYWRAKPRFKRDRTQVGRRPLSPRPPWYTKPLYAATLSSRASRPHLSPLWRGSPIHFPDRVTNIISEMPVVVQPPDTGGGRHCYSDLYFTWCQRATVVVELKYLRGGFWHGCRAGYVVGETVSAIRQRLQRHAELFRRLLASAASVPARMSA